MRRGPLASFTLVAALAGALIAQSRWSGTEHPASTAAAIPAAPRESGASLFCEFTGVADPSPLVGFHFEVGTPRASPTFALVFRRERDGSQTEFGGAEGPSPVWTFDGSDSPAVIRSPEDDTQINLYGYEPGRTGTVWFEAGLRSIRDKNLGGRCRQSA